MEIVCTWLLLCFRVLSVTVMYVPDAADQVRDPTCGFGSAVSLRIIELALVIIDSLEPY